MFAWVLNPRTGKTECIPHPFATMRDVPDLDTYYKSRGLTLVEVHTDDFVVL